MSEFGRVSSFSKRPWVGKLARRDQMLHLSGIFASSIGNLITPPYASMIKASIRCIAKVEESNPKRPYNLEFLEWMRTHVAITEEAESPILFGESVIGLFPTLRIPDVPNATNQDIRIEPAPEERGLR